MRRALRTAIFAALSLSAASSFGCRPSRAAVPTLQDEYRSFIFRDRPKVELKPESLGEKDLPGGLREYRVRITTEPGHQAVVRILRPQKDEKYPTVILQHYLGGDKDETVMTALLTGFASRGYLAAAIDGRYRGERGKEKTLKEAIGDTLRTGKGHPWLVDTVFDILRTLDYLEKRPDVDPTRIGMAGVSEGGIETWMAAAADERIRVAAPLIGVTRFKYVIEQAAKPAGKAYSDSFAGPLTDYARKIGASEVNERVIRQAWEQLLPGFTRRFDAARIVPLIAPRPLLILNHEKDEIIPLQGAREVHEAALVRYRELKAEEKLQMSVAPGLGHVAGSGDTRQFFQMLAEVDQMIKWFDRWLKPPAGEERTGNDFSQFWLPRAGAAAVAAERNQRRRPPVTGTDSPPRTPSARRDAPGRD